MRILFLEDKSQNFFKGERGMGTTCEAIAAVDTKVKSTGLGYQKSGKGEIRAVSRF